MGDSCNGDKRSFLARLPFLDPGAVFDLFEWPSGYAFGLLPLTILATVLILLADAVLALGGIAVLAVAATARLVGTRLRRG